MTIPAKNQGVYLQWKGYIDTQYQFSNFFDNDHTVMAWFMPQYVYGGEGAIIAENGSGQYRIGPGEYTQGNGGFKKMGDPVFRIRIGELTAMYLFPIFEKNKWHHIALSRSQGTFSLYLDGSHFQPVEKVSNDVFEITDEILLTSTTPKLPSGHSTFWNWYIC